MTTPLTRDEVQRLQSHMRKHGPHSLTPTPARCHLGTFLFNLPESHAWLSDMVHQTHAACRFAPAHKNRVQARLPLLVFR